MSRSFLDLIGEDGAKKAIERSRLRMQRQKAKRGLDVSPEIYMVSEFGYHFGWEAMLAIRRGYTFVPKTNEDLDEDKRNGRKPEWTSAYKREVFTLDEAQVLLEGGRKVWYSKLIETVHAGTVSNSFKSSSKSFESAIKPFTDKAEIEG